MDTKRKDNEKDSAPQTEIINSQSTTQREIKTKTQKSKQNYQSRCTKYMSYVSCRDPTHFGQEEMHPNVEQPTMTNDDNIG